MNVHDILGVQLLCTLACELGALTALAPGATLPVAGVRAQKWIRPLPGIMERRPRTDDHVPVGFQMDAKAPIRNNIFNQAAENRKILPGQGLRPVRD